jgi:hypothetical protein
MDNVTDFFMPDQGPAHRVSLGDGPWKTTAVMDNGEVPTEAGKTSRAMVASKTDRGGGVDLQSLSFLPAADADDIHLASQQ